MISRRASCDAYACRITQRSLLACGLLALGACGGGSSTPGSGQNVPPPSPDPLSPINDVSEPYRNPHLADSSWPIFHANAYSTAASLALGPGVIREVQTIDALTGTAGADPYVSPWTVFGEVYADGSQPVLTTPNDGVAKYLLSEDRFEPIDFLPLNRNALDFDWGILLLRGGGGVVTERRSNNYVVFGDERADDPFSPLEIKKRIPVVRSLYGGLLAHHSLAPDGTLIALTDANRLIAIDLNTEQVVGVIDLPGDSGASFQNSFPIDENGRIYISAQNLTVAVDWDGTAFSLAWSAEYDMRGPGCEDVPPDRPRVEEIRAVANGEPCTGTGTTPSLIGTLQDGISVIVDGHQPQNNLVAFWRDEPPADWEALADPGNPGKSLDRRVAGVFALPYSTPDGIGFTAQNSPSVRGSAVVSAQWAGFDPAPNALKGVQRVDWNSAARRFELVWANPDILFNGVPTIACTRPLNCQAYGMGRYGNEYEYISLDFDTGEERSRIALGNDDAVLDQGNNHSVANDGSIVYGARLKMVRVQ